MRAISGFVALLLVGHLAAAPTSKESDEDIVITKEFFPLEFVKYKGQHDIVNLLVPLNSLNFDEDESSESDSNETDAEVTIFFVEADITPEGKRIYQGLYVLKDGKATKLLDNGRDAAASGDNSTLVFFGASDGIYVYKDGSIEKYGSLTDSIIAIAKEKSGDVIYILTENNEVYKVTDSGNKKEKIDAIGNAKQIVLDYSNNLYFYFDKKVQVLTSEGIKTITGLPENPSSVTIIKPPFVIDEGVPVIVNESTYIAYPNGTSERAGIEFNLKSMPTAYASEAALIQYYAHDKKIYEYNILLLLLSTLFEELKSYLNDKGDEIRSLATRSKTFSR